MDSKDVEEIFKVVLTDDASQESQGPNNSSMLLISNNGMGTIPQAQNGVVMVQNQDHTSMMSPSTTCNFFFYHYFIICDTYYLFSLAN